MEEDRVVIGEMGAYCQKNSKGLNGETLKGTGERTYIVRLEVEIHRGGSD